YDDQEHLAALTDPALSTVALPHYDMGYTAADLLLGATGNLTPEVRRLDCVLVPRGSVGPPGRRTPR
ncbi:MAG: substrate-binding domain-containing protein, partial [Rhodococcus sp. (in: high G+C Gram-positive bacteria)]